MDLSGKTALITGIGSGDGIGGAVAESFLAHGATVIVTGRDRERGESYAHRLGGSVRFVLSDLSDEQGVRSLAESVGSVDILVNNAAVALGGPALDQDVASFDESFAVNVRAPYFLTTALAPNMAANGGGSVVNIGTMAARIGLPGLSVYSATKAAVEAFTRTFAAEFAASRIRVNVVAPGPTMSGKFSAPDSIANQLAQTLPMKRAAATEEIAEAVLFLASDRASYITGTVLAVDGGRTAV